MSRIDLLSNLQEVDTRIDDLTHSRQELEKRLADDSTVVAARQNLDAAQRRVNDLRARVRALELQVSSLEDKIKAVDARLYGGRVSNPKELSGLEQDEQMLKRRKSELEDQTLDLMGENERIDAEATAYRAALERVTSARKDSVLRDETALRELESRVNDLARQREQRRAQLDANTLGVYDSLRREKKGRAVARIKGSSCSACGVSVPSGIASRARLGEELAFCTNCGRILVV